MNKFVFICVFATIGNAWGADRPELESALTCDRSSDYKLIVEVLSRAHKTRKCDDSLLAQLYDSHEKAYAIWKRSNNKEDLQHADWIGLALLAFGSSKEHPEFNEWFYQNQVKSRFQKEGFPAGEYNKLP